VSRSRATETEMARAYFDWQRHFIQEPLPSEGEAARIARDLNIGTEETWAKFKLFVLNFTLYGRWGTGIRVRYSLAGSDMDVSERTAQNLVTGARQLGWLPRVKQAGSKGGVNGGGTTAVWCIHDPRAIVEDPDDFDVTDDPWWSSAA
jgi:hypothetical protein